MDEAKIREGFGVRATAKPEHTRWVHTQEGDAFVSVILDTLSAHLTPDQARRLASRLYRLARRVDARTSPA